MSLKAFHFVFIAASIVLACLFGAWALGRSNTAAAAGALLFAVVLLVYGFWFLRKVRTQDEERRRRRKLIQPLAVLVACMALATRTAGACSVCYGEAQGPMIDAARLGVWLLFALVLLMQVSFAAFFVQIHRKSKASRPERSCGR